MIKRFHKLFTNSADLSQPQRLSALSHRCTKKNPPHVWPSPEERPTRGLPVVMLRLTGIQEKKRSIDIYNIYIYMSVCAHAYPHMHTIGLFDSICILYKCKYE